MSTAGSNTTYFSQARRRRKLLCRVYIQRHNDDISFFNVHRRWALVGIVFAVLFGLAYIAATGYLMFRDDILAASLARTVRIQQAYEDRIAVLRSDIDRLRSRQFLNQEAFDERLTDLVGRQNSIDARHTVIAGLSGAAQKAGLVKNATTAPLPRLKPRLRPGGTDPVTTGSIETDDQEPDFEDMELRRAKAPQTPPAYRDPRSVAKMESSLDLLALEQVAYVETLARSVSERTAKLASALKAIGQYRGTPPESGIGGPFTPLDAYVDPETFENDAALVTDDIEEFEKLRDVSKRLPIAEPIPGARRSSGFGRRKDPFTRRPAMHSGLDFRSPTGRPVQTTAPGKVVKAVYTKGYGNLVEVDHGGGFTTRYGHLSKLKVKRGQWIGAGEVVGLVGSTGRSTGPHLHYEVRIRGKAVDPSKYIKAGKQILPLLKPVM